jgi:hypothetical protein
MIGGGPGDLRAAEIAEAMFQACRAALQMIPEHLGPENHAGDSNAALCELEGLPCPCCGRPFGLTGNIDRSCDASP